MQKNTRFVSGALAALFMAGAVMTPIAANASEEGRRNTTLGLGAVTGYLFTRGGSKVPAFIAAGGTAYAYKKYQDSINARHKKERARALARERARRYHAMHHHRAAHH